MNKRSPLAPGVHTTILNGLRRTIRGHLPAHRDPGGDGNNIKQKGQADAHTAPLVRTLNEEGARKLARAQPWGSGEVVVKQITVHGTKRAVHLWLIATANAKEQPQSHLIVSPAGVPYGRPLKLDKCVLGSGWQDKPPPNFEAIADERTLLADAFPGLITKASDDWNE